MGQEGWNHFNNHFQFLSEFCERHQSFVYNSMHHINFSALFRLISLFRCLQFMKAHGAALYCFCLFVFLFSLFPLLHFFVLFNLFFSVFFSQKFNFPFFSELSYREKSLRNRATEYEILFVLSTTR